LLLFTKKGERDKRERKKREKKAERGKKGKEKRKKKKKKKESYAFLHSDFKISESNNKKRKRKERGSRVFSSPLLTHYPRLLYKFCGKRRRARKRGR